MGINKTFLKIIVTLNLQKNISSQHTFCSCRHRDGDEQPAAPGC